MGQAFDRDNNVLGEAEGATKQEVFDKLHAAHQNADRFEIRTLRDKEATTQPVDRMEQFFRFAHLPAHLQAVSRPFGELAAHLIATLPSNPERTVALRKLLEAKDCAVRALLFE